jgi:hypothetical protein
MTISSRFELEGDAGGAQSGFDFPGKERFAKTNGAWLHFIKDSMMTVIFFLW